MNLIAFSRSRNCVNTQYAALSGAMSSLLDETLPLSLHHMILAVGRMLNTHIRKVNPMPTPFSPIPILSALKFYNAPFSPTLAVFCYQGNYFSLSNYFICM